jgi:endonuclease/exonuclease/phosphatase family metal-dependent hydrolase
MVTPDSSMPAMAASAWSAPRALLFRAALVALAIACALAPAIRSSAPREARRLRVATYNIRRFGREPTDLDRLASVFRAVDADVIAVQEIQDAARLDELFARLGRGRAWKRVLSACGGRSEMLVGFLYDSARVTLEETREFPELDGEDGRCSEGERAGLLARFSSGGRALTLLAVHLAAGASPEHAGRRRMQWRRALAILATVEGDKALVGDTNSAGWLDDAYGEREFIEREVARAGLELVTRPLACSEYFHAGDDALEPSLLDHVAATPGVARAGSLTLHGYCAELACRPHHDAPPAEFSTVSDHCPVSFEW